jgi:hypothetical protein
MPWLIGVVLAAATCGLATIASFDRYRAFYPVTANPEAADRLHARTY